MANTTVSLTIAEADAARTKTALMSYTGLGASATPKQLAAAALKKLVVNEERQNQIFVEPGVE